MIFLRLVKLTSNFLIDTNYLGQLQSVKKFSVLWASDILFLFPKVQIKYSPWVHTDFFWFQVHKLHSD